MNKVTKPILPGGESEYDRRLNSVLERWNYAVAQSIGQAADGYVHNTTSVSTSYTASINDSVVIVDSTTGSKTVFLKAADQCKNKRVVVKKADASANVVIIEPNGSELIDNVSAYTISATYGSIDAVSDGTKWWVV